MENVPPTESSWIVYTIGIVRGVQAKKTYKKWFEQLMKFEMVLDILRP